MYEDIDWVVFQDPDPDDTIELRIEALPDINSLDFDRSVVVMNGKRPSYEDVLSISRKCSEQGAFMTVFNQVVMVQPLMYLKSQFSGYPHLCEIPDPMVYEIECSKNCVVVDIFKRMKCSHLKKAIVRRWFVFIYSTIIFP